MKNKKNWGSWNFKNRSFNCGYEVYLVSLWMLLLARSCVVLYTEYVHLHIYEMVLVKGYCFLPVEVWLDLTWLFSFSSMYG